MRPKIIICGIGRSGTTWVRDVLVTAVGPILNEPLAPWSDYPACKELMSRHKVEHRLAYWLGEINQSTLEPIVAGLFEIMGTILPARGFKTIDKPLFELYRKLDPDCRIIYVRRDPYGRLMSMVWWASAWLNFPSKAVVKHKPLRKVIKAFLQEEGVVGRDQQDLYAIALFWELVDRHWMSLLPEDSLIADYNKLASDWHMWWPKVFEYCGADDYALAECLPKPGSDRLYPNRPENLLLSSEQVREVCDAVAKYLGEAEE